MMSRYKGSSESGYTGFSMRGDIASNIMKNPFNVKEILEAQRLFGEPFAREQTIRSLSGLMGYFQEKIDDANSTKKSGMPMVEAGVVNSWHNIRRELNDWVCTVHIGGVDTYVDEMRELRLAIE